MKSEPAITTGVVTAAAAATITLLVSFNVPLTSDQQLAILGVVGVAAPLIVGIVTRFFVSPA